MSDKKIGRDADTGQFIPVKEAERRTKTATIETMPSSPSKGNKIGRDADTGQFIPVKEAERRPKTSVVETLPKKK